VLFTCWKLTGDVVCRVCFDVALAAIVFDVVVLVKNLHLVGEATLTFTAEFKPKTTLVRAL